MRKSFSELISEKYVLEEFQNKNIVECLDGIVDSLGWDLELVECTNNGLSISLLRPDNSYLRYFYAQGDNNMAAIHLDGNINYVGIEFDSDMYRSETLKHSHKPLAYTIRLQSGIHRAASYRLSIKVVDHYVEASMVRVVNAGIDYSSEHTFRFYNVDISGVYKLISDFMADPIKVYERFEEEDKELKKRLNNQQRDKLIGDGHSLKKAIGEMK